MNAPAPQNAQRFAVPIWDGEDRVARHWEPARDAHCLIVGGTEEDRAVTIGETITRFLEAGYRVWKAGGPLVDGTPAWRDREGADSVQAVTVDDQTAMVFAAHELMTERLQDDATATYEPMLLVIADLAEVQAALETIADVALFARVVRIHLLIAGATPSPALLSGPVRVSIPVRVPLDEITAQNPLL